MAKNKPVLKIFEDRSVLYDSKGNSSEFIEGKLSDEAKERLKLVRKKLESGFLEDVIEKAKKPDVVIDGLSDENVQTIEKLVVSVTSEVGRAVVGLTVLQLTIKAISPTQSIRLHKGSNAAKFSWVEGIPMRVLDKNFITPVLRKHKLLRLNADGFMMTRSLAENYPYSQLYKAAIRGAKEEWIKIVDWVENEEMDAEKALLQLLAFLNNRSEDFLKSVEEATKSLNSFIELNPSFEEVLELIEEFVDESAYSARIFEISVHALFQVFEDAKCLEGYLKPISQMRSANKKHGNIGDIEITASKDGLDILESWDAKYGKTYLRDELEEINEKLIHHPQCKAAGFITDAQPNLKKEITDRMEELSIIHEVTLGIFKFSDWVNLQTARFELNYDGVGKNWITALVESICQQRRERCPIDEPTGEWVESLTAKLTEKSNKTI